MASVDCRRGQIAANLRHVPDRQRPRCWSPFTLRLVSFPSVTIRPIRSSVQWWIVFTSPAVAARDNARCLVGMNHFTLKNSAGVRSFEEHVFRRRNQDNCSVPEPRAKAPAQVQLRKSLPV